MCDDDRNVKEMTTSLAFFLPLLLASPSLLNRKLHIAGCAAGIYNGAQKCELRGSTNGTEGEKREWLEKYSQNEQKKC